MYAGRREPKPFIFVDVPRRVEGRNPIYHDSLKENTLTGRLDLQFTVESRFLFVNSGVYDLDKVRRAVFYPFIRSKGTPIIPGTSIKGAVRSIVEAISGSCVRQHKRNEHPPHQGCKSKDSGGRQLICTACRIFGLTGYAGRLSFSDATPASPEAVTLEIVKIAALYGPKPKDKRKFYVFKEHQAEGNLRPERGFWFVEAAKQGSKFTSSMHFRNLYENELALLLHAMGIGLDYGFKVGGAKPRCFGMVKAQATGMTLLEGLWSERHISGGELDSLIAKTLDRKDLIDEQLLDQYLKSVRRVAGYCPRRNY